MGDAKDDSVKIVNMECNKRKILYKNKVVASKRRPVEEPPEPDQFSLNYLPDQLLLYIFRNLNPIQLKAIAFTCVRMHRLIRDYTLWSKVDATDTKVGTKRLRWFLENCFHENTVSIKLRGFSKELKGCLGIVDKAKAVSEKDDDIVVYTNLVTINDPGDSSEEEHVSCDDDDDDDDDDEGDGDGGDEGKNNGETETKPSEDEVRDPEKVIATDQPEPRFRGDELGLEFTSVNRVDGEVEVEKVNPPTMPRQCSCTMLACPNKMSKEKPWPKPVLDRMDEILNAGPIEATVFCSKPTFTLTEKLLSQLIVRCPNITELDLGYCNIDCKTTPLASFPPSLVKLSLCGTRMYNVPKPKTMLYHIHERLPRLEYLDVSKCEWLTPDTWLSMSKLPKLRALIATDCPCMKDFIAYASLATKYGFPVLEYVDFRGSPLSDSEVSALGWVPTLRELYLSPPLSSLDENFNLHTHFMRDKLWRVDELEEWEKKDYMKLNRGRSAGKKYKKRRAEGGAKLPLKKRKVDGDECKAGPSNAATSKANPDPQPGTSKDDAAASTSKANAQDDVEPSTSGANNEDEFLDIDDDSKDDVFPANGYLRGAPPNAPFRQYDPDDPRGPTNLIGVRQILICQGGTIYQYTYDLNNPNVGNRDIGFQYHLPPNYVLVPNPKIKPGTSNIRRVRMVANLGNHLQLIDRQFNRQLELFRCTSLVTDVSVRYFGRSVGDEFVHIGPRRDVAAPNVPREATRNDVSNLRVLVVFGYSGITDVSLKHLSSAAPFLKFLDVRNTMVTEQGVSWFLSLRPEVEVLFGNFDVEGHNLSGYVVT